MKNVLIVEDSKAVAVLPRTVWPMRQPSPKKSRGLRRASTASLPVVETTVIFTLPDSMISLMKSRSRFGSTSMLPILFPPVERKGPRRIPWKICANAPPVAT